MTGRERPSSELSRDLTLFQITMMGVGMMIGAGVFLGIGNSIHQAGPGGVMLTFALNGVIALFTAMSYAELSSAIPRAGGAYNFARVGFGRGTSFLAGWMEWFASSASMMFLLLFFLVNLCVIKIRRNMGDELRYGFLMPCFPLFPVIAIVCQAALAGWLVHMSWIAWIVAPVWILAGFGIYHAYSKSRAVTTEDEILVLEEEKAPEGDEYRIMVAVEDPENAIELVRNTYKLCVAKEARAELLHMVPVPDQVPLADAGRYALAGKEGIVEATLYLARPFPLSTSVRYCRNVGRGIISAVREKKIDMLIMGWHGRPKAYLFSLGSTVDPVVERSPSNVVIMKDCGGNREFKRVLVPVAGGPNSAFALEVASILAEKNEGTITAFAVATGKSRFDVEKFVDENRDRLRIPRERVCTKTVAARGVAEAVLKEAADYDLVVLGCTRRPRLYQFARSSIPIVVARACKKPLIVVKASGGIRSWIERRI